MMHYNYITNKIATSKKIHIINYSQCAALQYVYIMEYIIKPRILLQNLY